MNLRLAHAILAGAQIATAGTTLADILGAKMAGLIVLLIGAAQGGLAVYQYGQNNPPTPTKPAA